MTDLDNGAEIRDLFDRSLADLDVPTDRLRARSAERGRALRRRRRVATAASAVAVAAATAFVVVPTVSGSGTTQGQVAHESQDPTSAPYVRPPGWWDMPGTVMASRLGGLLPANLSMTDVNTGDQNLAPGEVALGGWLQVDLRDRKGRPAGGLNLVLYPPDRAEQVRELTTCPGNLEPTLVTSCDEMHQGGRSVGRISRTEDHGVVTIEVTRLAPSGGTVYGAVSNSSDDKWGAGSSIDRPRPALDASALKAIVMSETWQVWDVAHG